MKILVLGSGGREHAIIKALQQSKHVSDIYNIPGISAESEQIRNYDIKLEDFEEIISLVKKEQIDLTVVGPEQALVDGIVDYFQNENCAIFGPSAYAAQLEGSKAFAKSFMKKYKIPTANYERFTDYKSAEAYVKSISHYPLVIKASGLAAGKGVIIAETLNEAIDGLKSMFIEKKFGHAADEIVIEEFMEGEEASVFAICDGQSFVCLSPAQDHKRIGEGDRGKNTGGMGAYAPAKIVTESIMKQVEDTIIRRVLDGLSKEGHPYKGVLYCGLMIHRNEVKVVEFNVRFGDPETQVILPLLESDIVDLFQASIANSIDKIKLKLSNDFAITVVMASGGYPDTYEINKKISGLDLVKNSTVIHCATRKTENDLYTNGGRVLNLVTKASSAQLAAEMLYADIKKIHFDSMYYRRDIGHRILK